jgi:hypothetical protein
LKGDAMDLSGVEENLRKGLQEYVMPNNWDEVEFFHRKFSAPLLEWLKF